MSRAPNAVAAKAKALLSRRISARILPWRGRVRIDHPLGDAKGLRHALETLPRDDARQALEDVSHWLDSIHQTPAFAPAQRYALISALDHATRPCQALLLAQYVALRRDRVIEEKRVWQTMSEFWSRLATGYLDCAPADEHADLAARELQDRYPQLAARGLRALRYQLKWLLLRYAEIPADLWPACARLIALAERGAAAAAPLTLYDDSKTQTSPQHEFLRLAMYHSVAPGNLSPAEQHIAERLVVYLTRKFRFDVAHHNGYDYYFDLHGRRPPLRRFANSPATAATRYLDVSDARHWTSAAYALVIGTGRLPSDLDWGSAVETTMVKRVLQHLNVQWAKAAPPRAAARRKTEGDLNAVHGYPNVLRAIVPPDAEPADDADAPVAASWSTEDISNGGYGVVAPAGASESLHVGDIVALRAEGDVAWAVGVIRRLTARSDKRRHIGLQLLTKAAIPVQVRSMSGTARNGKRQWSILLDEQPSADGSLYIVARRGLLDTGEAIEARFGSEEGTSVILEPSGLVESGADFDRLRYRMTAVAF